jgi:hypothetical protein
MDDKLEANPAILKKGMTYLTIQLTNTAVHTAVKTPTPSLGKKIQKALEADKPGRIYFPVDPTLLENSRDYILKRLMLDTDFIQMVREVEARGNKILIEIPEGGIPTVAGKDTEEFLDSKNGKRLLRGLAKGKGKE